MAKAAANLAVSVTAKTKNFRKQMTTAQKITAAFGSAVKKAALGVAALGTAAATSAAIGMSLLVKKSFQTIDATGKLAARLKDSSEAIIGLRHAAEITGAGAASLDKGLEQLSKRLGEVRVNASGSGEAKDAIAALGINIDEIVNKRPSEAFKEIADRISQLGNRADQTAVAYKLFGRTGIKLLNTLDLGAAGLADMTREAEALGSSFSNLDASKVEAANDAIFRLKQTFTGLAQVIAIQIAPVIEEMAAGITLLTRNAELLGVFVDRYRPDYWLDKNYREQVDARENAILNRQIARTPGKRRKGTVPEVPGIPERSNTAPKNTSFEGPPSDLQGAVKSLGDNIKTMAQSISSSFGVGSFSSGSARFGLGRANQKPFEVNIADGGKVTQLLNEMLKNLKFQGGVTAVFS